MKVNVTEKHIQDGVKKSCCSCPVAIAINSPIIQMEFPKIALSSVHLKDGHCTIQGEQGGPKMIHKFSLPKIAQDFVAKFQLGETVSPIQFDIDLVAGHSKTSIGGTL